MKKIVAYALVFPIATFVFIINLIGLGLKFIGEKMEYFTILTQFRRNVGSWAGLLKRNPRSKSIPKVSEQELNNG